MTGRETINGVETIGLRGDVASEDIGDLITSADPGHPVVLSVWVSAQDQSVQQIKILGKVFDEDGDGTSRLIKMSEYDEPVDIQLPENTTG